MNHSIQLLMWTTSQGCFAHSAKCSLLLFPTCSSSIVLITCEKWSCHCKYGGWECDSDMMWCDMVYDSGASLLGPEFGHNHLLCVTLEGDTEREDVRMKMEAEIGVVLPRTKGWQGLLATTRSWKRQRFSSGALRGSMTLLKPWFWTSSLQNWTVNLGCLSHPVCGI